MSAEVIALPGTAGHLTRATWTSMALYRASSRDRERAQICGVHMDATHRVAVATNGHALFASRGDFEPSMAGKTLEPKAWFGGGQFADTCMGGNYPAWTDVLPEEVETDIAVTIPPMLLPVCRAVNLRALVMGPTRGAPGWVRIGSESEVTEYARQMPREDVAQTRLVNPDLVSSMSGQAVRICWSRRTVKWGDRDLGLPGPLIVVPDHGRAFSLADASKEQLLTGGWPWFSVVMPMRPVKV